MDESDKDHIREMLERLLSDQERWLVLLGLTQEDPERDHIVGE